MLQPSRLAPPPPLRATRRRPERRTQGGADALFAEALGRPFFPWQRYVADVAGEIDEETGLLAYDTVIVTVQRQAGKTSLIAPMATRVCLSGRARRVWFTAQTGKDAGEWLRDEYAGGCLADASVFAGKWVQKLRPGSEEVRWPASRSFFRVFPPQRDAIHGKQSDRIFIDEGWAHSLERGDELLTAATATQSTRPNAQVWILSTAGDASSEWFLAQVLDGRAAVLEDSGRGVAFFEWGIDDDVDVDDLEAVAAAHPAVKPFGLIDPAFLAAERRRLGPDRFARNYGNRWVAVTQSVIPASRWRATTWPGTWPKPSGRVVLGFDVGMERADAAITATWRHEGRVLHDVVEHRPGADWLPARMLELRDAWHPAAITHERHGPVLDVADEVARLLDPHREGEPLWTAAGLDYPAACQRFLADVMDDRMRHPDHKALTDAATAAARRRVGDSWVWSRRESGGSIAALVAATVGAWALDHAPLEEALPAFRALDEDGDPY